MLDLLPYTPRCPVLSAAMAFARWPDAFSKLTSEDFVPHGYCYLWNRQLLMLHVTSDAMITLAYIGISVSLLWLVYREHERLPFRWMFAAFGLFIVACGVTHLLEIVVLWRPLYWLLGSIKLVTAVASAGTACALPFLLSRAGTLLLEARNSRTNELRFLAASDNSHDAFFILESIRDSGGEIIDFHFAFLNTHAGELLSGKPQDFQGKRLRDTFPITHGENFFDEYKRVVETGERCEREHAANWPTLRASWLRLQVIKLGDGVAITTTNISALKESELKLAKLASFTQSIIANSPFATIVVDTNGTIVSINPAAEQMLRYSAAELVDRETPLILLHPLEIERRAEELSRELETVVAPGIDVLTAKAKQGLVDEAEWTFYRRGGTHLPVQLTASAMSDAAGQTVGVILIAYDITERKRTSEYITYLAQHDALTALPTRNLLHDRLGVSLKRADRNRRKVALLALDLDNFKGINDSMGHHAGDQLLAQIARRLKNAVRASDTVARMGGDEFVVVLDDLHGLTEAEAIAEKLLVAVRSSLSIGSQVIAPTVSMGVCLYPDQANSVELMLRNADEAMYRAKAGGRNGYRTFTKAMELETNRRRHLDAGLKRALALDEFELLYQPQVSLHSGKVCGVEALLRWHSGKLGKVMPQEFIPVAEENGLIGPIGDWVLRRACKEGAWLRAEMGRGLSIAVNVSPRQFYQDDLPALIEDSLKTSGLEASCLEIEITENVLVSDSPKALSVLEQVRSLGVRVALDDFGTGYSSMSYIMRFRVDRIKIDRSFVCNMTEDPGSSAIASAIIALAAGLDIRIVAEGVETAAHRDLLRSKNCDEGQGYYYTAPVRMDELIAVIHAIELAEDNSSSVLPGLSTGPVAEPY